MLDSRSGSGMNVLPELHAGSSHNAQANRRITSTLAACCHGATGRRQRRAIHRPMSDLRPCPRARAGAACPRGCYDGAVARRESRAATTPLAGERDRPSLAAFVAGAAVGAALAVGLAEVRRGADSRGPSDSAPSDTALTAAAPSATAEPSAEPPSGDTPAAETPTTAAALTPSAWAPSPELPSPPATPPEGPEPRAPLTAPPARKRDPARARPVALRADTPEESPGRRAPPTPTPTKAELARRLSPLRTTQPALATALTVELNELDADDHASLNALARRIAEAVAR